VRAEVVEVVERLRSARSLAWLRVIDDADLDHTVEPVGPVAALELYDRHTRRHRN
jgi:hypothetical protein